MLLDEVAPRRTATLIENLDLESGGVAAATMAEFVADNVEAVGMKFVRGDLSEALASGQPFLAVVDKGHAVMINGVETIDGIRYARVYDPLQSTAYLERISQLDARLVRDTTVIGHPTMWAEKP